MLIVKEENKENRGNLTYEGYGGPRGNVTKEKEDPVVGTDGPQNTSRSSFKGLAKEMPGNATKTGENPSERPEKPIWAIGRKNVPEIKESSPKDRPIFEKSPSNTGLRSKQKKKFTVRDELHEANEQFLKKYKAKKQEEEIFADDQETERHWGTRDGNSIIDEDVKISKRPPRDVKKRIAIPQPEIDKTDAEYEEETDDGLRSGTLKRENADEDKPVLKAKRQSIVTQLDNALKSKASILVVKYILGELVRGQLIIDNEHSAKVVADDIKQKLPKNFELVSGCRLGFMEYEDTIYIDVPVVPKLMKWKP